MTVKEVATMVAKELGYDSLDQMKRHIQYLRRLAPAEFRHEGKVKQPIGDDK